MAHEEFDWIQELKAGGDRQELALDRLRSVLMRGLSHSLTRRGGGDAFAEDVVQNSLVKIMGSIDSFEGRSRFTTWAMTIATRVGISELRRRHFRDVSLDQITGDDDLKIELAVDGDHSPAQTEERESLLKQLKDAIEDALTDRQRQAIQALLNGMPVEEIARRTDANRNAVYKLFHDARKKLRIALEKQGVTLADVQSVIG